MLLMIALGLVAAIAVVLLVASRRPDTLRVVRTAAIKAPPEKIFAVLNDYHRWTEWSPYEVKDPGMTRTLSGATSGVGAKYAWEGNGNVGKGNMEILRTTPPTAIHMALRFEKPFPGNNTIDFVLEPKGDTTVVTWDMQGPAPLMTKVMGMLMDMDKMIGTDFEIGLQNLRKLTEA